MKGVRATIRTNGISILLVFIILVVCALAVGPRLASDGVPMGTLTREGDVVISAIESYRADHGKLPADLQDLVPRYLPKLEKVVYLYRKSYNFPARLFDGPRKSHWAYKTSRDGKSFAIGVEARPYPYYDGRKAEWLTADLTGFENYDK